MSSPQPDDQEQRNIPELFTKLRDQQLEELLDTVRKAVLAGDAQKVIMSLAMLLALTVCPAMLGTQEAIRQSQSKNKREEHRARRCNLVVSCVKPSIRSRDINGKLVVLNSGKLYITTRVPAFDGPDSTDETVVSGHPFSGYFLPYPDAPYEGLVSTIADDPPMLNWIYVDKDTYEVKYGVRAEAQAHLTGPFDCTRQDRRMTLEGWEGFAAVEEFPGIWALYFDRDDDGLATKVAMGTRVLEVELTRREKKERKPEPDPAQQPMTLDEKMRQHKAETAREEQERQQFVGADAPPAAEAAAAAEDADDRSATAVEVTIENLSDIQAQAPSQEERQATADPISPSAVSGNLSFWSAARREGEGVDDENASVTAASSTLDRAAAELSLEDTGYKKPYVEDEN